jgi:hypothetical protein
MANLRIYESVDLPQWAIPYIHDGDVSGLENEEVDLIDDWIMSLPNGVTYCFGKNNSFCNNPAFGLPCSTTKTIILID